MITKAELKQYSLLLKKNFRDELAKFLVEGEKLIFEAIKSGFKCEIIIVRSNYSEISKIMMENLSKNAGRLEIIPAKDFQKLQATVNAQGIVGVFKKNISKVNSKKIKAKLIVALENINDPGNVGSILRNTDWFGVKEILLSNNCADIYNSKTIRASAGSIFHLTLVIDDNLIQSLSSYKQEGYRVLCADIAGNNIYLHRKIERVIIVFSNEAKGPTDKLLNIMDEKVTVPKKGMAESLNVASASAIILSELTRD